MLVSGPLVVKILILITSLVRLKHENVTVARVMENDLLNDVFSLKDALFVREFCNVDWGLGVVR